MKEKHVVMTGSDLKMLDFTLRGKPGSPLVVHNFSEECRKQIRDKQQKKVKKAKAERVPLEEFEASKYLDEEGRECVHSAALKKSFISAVTGFDDLTKIGLRQAIFVSPTLNPNGHLIPIELHNGKLAKGKIREDAVTIGNNIRGLTYRPEYKEWQLRITVDYNSRIISAEQLEALIEHAGWGVGICEGRPERSSALGWGRYEIVK